MAALVVIFAVSGCGDPPGTSTRDKTAPPATAATAPRPQTSPVTSTAAPTTTPAASGLRGILVSTDAPSVDVALDGALVAVARSYGASTPYVVVNAGNHDVRGVKSGTQTMLFDFMENTMPGKDYTLIGAPGASIAGLSPSAAGVTFQTATTLLPRGGPGALQVTAAGSKTVLAQASAPLPAGHGTTVIVGDAPGGGLAISALVDF